MNENNPSDMFRELDENNPTIIKGFIRRIILKNFLDPNNLAQSAKDMGLLFVAVANNTVPKDSRLKPAYENMKTLLRAGTLSELKHICELQDLQYLDQDEMKSAKVGAIDRMDSPLPDLPDK